jgi:hypothetical protein
MLKQIIIAIITVALFSTATAQAQVATGQQNSVNRYFPKEYELKFLAKIENNDDVRRMDDSLPLLICLGRVFQMRSECLQGNAAGGLNYRNAAGGSNGRDAGGGNNKRDAAGGNNARAAAGGDNQRNATGGNNARNAAGGDNQRNAAGGNNLREAAGGDNQRNAAGGNNAREAAGGDDKRNAGGGNNQRDAGGGDGKRDAAGGANQRDSEGGDGRRAAGDGSASFTCGTDPSGDLVIYFHNIRFDKSTKIYYHQKFYSPNRKTFKIIEL